MNPSAHQRSAAFLEIADQFRLGELVTEASHPVTAHLGEVAKGDVAEALRLLFRVDEDVVRTYEAVARSGRLRAIAQTVVQTLRAGGRIFFTGCGSTGRLSILLDSIWRDYWRTATPRGAAADWGSRTFSVMAGGDYALIKAVEGFEDYTAFGRKQIRDLGLRAGDVVFAITEGGETSFVIGTAWEGVEAGAKVYFVYNNPDETLCRHVERSREVIREARIEKLNLTTGPMAITGSTRMQATSIQLAVLVTVLDSVVRELESGAPGSPGNLSPVRAQACPAQFLTALAGLHATLGSNPALSQLANLVLLEESVYRAGRKVNYFADRAGIDLLTDTTERSPTYCTPPFRKFDDTTATESWAFLHVSAPDSPSAWEHICKRPPRCVDWKADDVRGLVPDDKFARTAEIISRIGYGELMRFRIGLDGIRNRPLGPGDGAVALVVESEKESLFAPGGFHRVQLENAVQAGARTGLIFVGCGQSCRAVGEFVAQWNPQCTTVLLPVPKTDFLLDGVMRVGLKMLLNALSTCTMVRLGRVMGNTMIYVVPSNLKLIDRATRYIARLANLDYAEANRLLFEVIEYVEPRMKSDQGYPPVVGLAVLRARHGLGNEAAERRLDGLG
ncbi:MAG: hypothetical protein MUC91_06570 [Verrucomicrobia bacterium]|nr:hypothetical protein [Verrucomicrobiota bacterium]